MRKTIIFLMSLLLVFGLSISVFGWGYEEAEDVTVADQPLMPLQVEKVLVLPAGYYSDIQYKMSVKNVTDELFVTAVGFDFKVKYRSDDFACWGYRIQKSKGVTHDLVGVYFDGGYHDTNSAITYGRTGVAKIGNNLFSQANSPIVPGGVRNMWYSPAHVSNFDLLGISINQVKTVTDPLTLHGGRFWTAGQIVEYTVNW